MKKIFFFFFFLPLFASSICAIDKTSDLTKYINILIQDALGMLDNPDTSLDKKTSKVDNVIATNFNFQLMGEYALGMHIKTTSDTELEQYIDAYSRYMINMKSQLVQHYHGQELTIISVNEINKDDFLVKTSIVIGNNKSIFINFYILSKEEDGVNVYKIYDLVTENISLVETQRAQYTSAINRRGIDYLIKMLRDKSSNNN